jgi:hypothetical protein
VLLDEGKPGRASGSVIGVEDRGKRMDGLDEGGGGEVERGKEEERWRVRHGTEIDSVGRRKGWGKGHGWKRREGDEMRRRETRQRRK